MERIWRRKRKKQNKKREKRKKKEKKEEKKGKKTKENRKEIITMGIPGNGQYEWLYSDLFQALWEEHCQLWVLNRDERDFYVRSTPLLVRF